jgi:hypothetical protein
MLHKAVPPLLLAVALGCEAGPSTVPYAPPPPSGILSVVLDAGLEDPSLAGMDSALVRVRNLFVAPDRLTDVKRIAVEAGGDPVSADFELPARTGYYAEVILYNSVTREAFGGGAVEHVHAAMVRANERVAVTVEVAPWVAELRAPASVLAERPEPYTLRVRGLPPMLMAGPPPFGHPFLRSWGVLSALTPWTPADRPPETATPGAKGATGAGWPPEWTYFAYHAAPRVSAEVVMYAKAYFVVGFADWREEATSELPEFRVYSDGLEEVRVRPAAN